MIRRVLCTLVLGLGTSFACQALAAGKGLVTRLEAGHVDISIQFKGEKLLLFGALPDGGNVIVKVVSPVQEVVLNRKVKRGFVWLDGGRMVVKSTPGLLYLLSSRPVGELLNAEEQARYRLRLGDALDQAGAVSGPAGMEGWRTAFLRLKRREGYYMQDEAAVTVEDDRLFYTSLSLPAKSPLGQYDLSIFLVRGGMVVARDHESLEVREVSVERWVSRLARERGWVFGGTITLGAVALGLALGIALRRKREV